MVENPRVAREEFSFLLGKTVEQIWVWGPIRLVVERGNRPEPMTYVDFEGAVLIDPDGHEAALNAVERPAEAGAVLGLLHDRIDGAFYEDGVLYLTFARGTSLRMLPDEHYETWTAVGEGRVFQCLPGGEVGSW